MTTGTATTTAGGKAGRIWIGGVLYLVTAVITVAFANFTPPIQIRPALPPAVVVAVPVVMLCLLYTSDAADE